MAHDERSLYVSLPGCTSFLLQIRMHNPILPPAGNSSLLLIMNGASFGDVAPIGGRYWSVVYSYMRLTSMSSHTLGSLTNLFVRHPIDLFPCTSGHPYTGNPLYCLGG